MNNLTLWGVKKDTDIGLKTAFRFTSLLSYFIGDTAVNINALNGIVDVEKYFS
ncbi:MAG: hypothetical protein ACTS8H_01540 [Arsenophonus sp. NC-PE1-MAG3]